MKQRHKMYDKENTLLPLLNMRENKCQDKRGIFNDGEYLTTSSNYQFEYKKKDNQEENIVNPRDDQRMDGICSRHI